MKNTKQKQQLKITNPIKRNNQYNKDKKRGVVSKTIKFHPDDKKLLDAVNKHIKEHYGNNFSVFIRQAADEKLKRELPKQKRVSKKKK